MCVCVCARARVCACVCACVRACVCVCVHARQHIAPYTVLSLPLEGPGYEATESGEGAIHVNQLPPLPTCTTVLGNTSLASIYSLFVL